jgi:hypothetical protein
MVFKRREYMLTEQPLARVGCDAVALKPTECDVSRAAGLSVDTVAIDYEGREHLPSAETLSRLTEHATVYLTTPVRADGFDPLGDNSLIEWIPDGIGRVLVAGNPAYLSEGERRRAVAPRLGAALDGSSVLTPWVGTEGIERLALAAGGVQYDLLSRYTLETVRGLRSVGYDGEIAIYAPTVLSDNDNVILDALGGYVARRQVVREALDGREESVTEDAGGTMPPVTDRRASGRTRDVLLTAAQDFALVGDSETVSERITALHDAGVDTVVAYPATGIETVE